MDEKTIKALLEVAGASANPDAVDGVLQVQKLIQENEALKVEFSSYKEASQQEHEKLKESLDRSTRDMAHIISTLGIVKAEPEKPKGPEDMYKRFREANNL